MDVIPRRPYIPLLAGPAGGHVLSVSGPDRDGQLFVVLEGEIDLATVPELAAVAATLAANGSHVVVDLQRVSFIDCAGLAAVLALDPSGHAPCLHAPSAPVRRLVALTARPEDQAYGRSSR